MTVDLDRRDIMALVLGSDPGYTYLTEFLNAGYGTYTGGFVDRYDWQIDGGLDKCTDEELYNIYLKCKNK